MNRIVLWDGNDFLIVHNYEQHTPSTGGCCCYTLLTTKILLCITSVVQCNGG